MLAEQLGHINFRDEQIEREWVSAEIAKRIRPFERELELLDSIPGLLGMVRRSSLRRSGWT